MRLLQEATEEGLATGVLTDVVLPLVLAAIMLGMGLGLRKAHFTLLLEQPRIVLAGLSGQLLALPLLGALVAWAAVTGFGLRTELALGLLLLSAAPGGATSNMLTWLARGDLALSVSLTAITSVFSFLLTPFAFFVTTMLVFQDASLITVSIMDVLLLTLVVVAGPVLLGMAIGTRFPNAAARVDKPLRITNLVVFILLIGAIIYTNREGFWGFAAATVPAALTLNVLAVAAGLGLAYAFRLAEPQKRAAVIEIGFQNGTFAILLATSQLSSNEAALMPGFYSLMMYVTGGALAGYWLRRKVAMRPLPRSAGM